MDMSTLGQLIGNLFLKRYLFFAKINFYQISQILDFGGKIVGERQHPQTIHF